MSDGAQDPVRLFMENRPVFLVLAALGFVNGAVVTFLMANMPLFQALLASLGVAVVLGIIGGIVGRLINHRRQAQ